MVPDWLLVAGLSGGLLAASAALMRRAGTRPGRRAALAGVALVVLAACWPSRFLHFGYDSYISLDYMNANLKIYSKKTPVLKSLKDVKVTYPKLEKKVIPVWLRKW